ncbi:Mov34-domain-containing protein [Choiromyces venosus 120613-1]|uniref:Mov34-domain-containing protein n=1 Tax=Choiromyces venosus 120613-1 TaxID=1336337 RepID=A0A3N4JKI7_9PEZI|nr:Mov34-domain-containing protein [Choiromyces venosus 120613-1]
MAFENDGTVGPYRAPPMSIKEIADKAVDFDYNPLIPLRYWLRTADTLLKEATIYQAEGNEQQAYLLLVRQAELVFRHLPDHPEAKEQENVRNLRVVRARSTEALKRLEYMKPRITARYEDYKLASRKARDDEYREHRIAASTVPTGYNSRSSATIPYADAATLSFSQGQTRKTSIPKPLDLSRGGRRGSTSSVTGPFSPPLEKSLSSGGLGPTIGDSAQLAMEIAKQEFEKREREKRARRRQLANEQGRGNVIVDSRGQEIKRISTPASAAIEQSYRNLLSQYQHENQGRDSGYGSVNEHAGYTGYYQGSPEEIERRLYQHARDEEEHRRRVVEQQEEEWDLARSIEALHMKADLSERQMQPSSARNSHRFSTSSTLSGWEEPVRERERENYVGNWKGNYPAVPKRRKSVTRMEPPLIPGPAADFVEIRSVTPTPPPKPPLYGYDGSSNSSSTTTAAPAIPYKKPLPYAHNHAPSPPPPLPNFPSSTATTPTATKHVPTTPEGFQFSTPATLENGTPLRTIFLPATLRQQFLLMAAPNTNRNLETCGILCGTLIKNALFVSRLVIPEQEATSDTCSTKDEEGLFEYVDREELMVLGWIHTHPTQTCFMSSVDLHTHCSYQLMLPESIAIVCAPRHQPFWGVFRLTDPPGVKTIMACRQSSLFHPHGELNVYTDAMRPGHVCEVREMGFDVVDLRKGGD